MKKSILFAGVFSTSILLSSCGVMFGGSKYIGNIKVTDNPEAEIYVNGEKIGKGEATKSFKRNQDLKVEIKEEGCEPKTQTFDKTFRTGNFILSAFSWGIIGAGVDLGTGASYKPDHKNNDAIKKVNDKKYIFNISYPDCK